MIDIVRKGLLLLWAVGLLASPARAEVDPAAFDRWLAAFRTEALAAGISADLLDASLTGLTPDPKILALDDRQPEFSLGFWDYYQRGVSEDRITRGRKKLTEHRVLLEKAGRRHNVQPRFLVALWGLESDFGRVKGQHNLIRSLATLAFDPRRGRFFRQQLLALLQIIDAGHLRLEEAKGSWAGAFGHTQFMPLTFLAHSIDGDGDGRKHLIESHEDALHSAANYLQSLGWNPHKTWGREVSIPPDFDYRHVGLKISKDLDDWHRLGVRKADGSRLPAVTLQASLIVPMGARGPGFLIYDNFRRIMRWNNSVFFALNVGLLSDAIAQLPPLKSMAPLCYRPLKTSQITKVQHALNQRGYDPGQPDGILGSRTRQSLRRFQRNNGLVGDGFPDRDTLNLLLEPEAKNLGNSAPKDDQLQTSCS